MQFAFNTFISCQVTRSSSYLYELRIKKYICFISISLTIGYIDFVMTTYIIYIYLYLKLICVPN